MTVLLVIALLVVLIVVHELGHFFAAKFFKVKVEEFGIGYPPRAFLLGVRKGTEYTLNWIPFGGFVRLFGDGAHGTPGLGSLASAARSKQAIIIVAGVAMNVVIAWVFFVSAYTLGILHVVDDAEAAALPSGSTTWLMVTDVVLGSPAHAAGMKAGDNIISIVDEAGAGAALSPSGVSGFIRERGGEELSVTYVRAEATTTVHVFPAHAVIAQESGRPAVGIGLALVSAQSMSLPEAMRAASASVYNAAQLVVEGVATIIEDSLRGEPNLQNVTGPIGLVGVVGDAAHNGLGYLLSLAAFISVNLAVINLIPIPALDGGRLVVIGVESLVRRPAPKLALFVLNASGIALIIFLMVAVTYNDLARLFM